MRLLYLAWRQPVSLPERTFLMLPFHARRTGLFEAEIESAFIIARLAGRLQQHCFWFGCTEVALDRVAIFARARKIGEDG